MAVEELSRLDEMFDQTAFADPPRATQGQVAVGSGAGASSGAGAVRGQRRPKPAYLLSNASRDNI